LKRQYKLGSTEVVSTERGGKRNRCKKGREERGTGVRKRYIRVKETRQAGCTKVVRKRVGGKKNRCKKGREGKEEVRKRPEGHKRQGKLGYTQVVGMERRGKRRNPWLW